MKKKNLVGILTVASFVLLILLLFMVQSQGEKVKSFYVQFTLADLIWFFALAGVYLVNSFSPEADSRSKYPIWALAAIFGFCGTLMAFDILPFLKSWNWVTALGILFILLVQLQLMNWGKRVHQLVRFSALFVILCDLFLIFFFIAKWRIYILSGWINLAATLSIALTFVALIFLRKQKESVQ